MKRMIITAGSVAVLCFSAILCGGCAAVRQSTGDVDVNKTKPMSAKYDYSDLRSMTDEIADILLAHEFIRNQSQPPVVVILGVENATKLHIDTKAMTDTLRGKLLASGKMRFVNAGRRGNLLTEQSYQQKHAVPETRVAIGKQLGAKYMLTAIRQIGPYRPIFTTRWSTAAPRPTPAATSQKYSSGPTRPHQDIAEARGLRLSG